jgi:hypothetical protein
VNAVGDSENEWIESLYILRQAQPERVPCADALGRFAGCATRQSVSQSVSCVSRGERPAIETPNKAYTSHTPNAPITPNRTFPSLYSTSRCACGPLCPMACTLARWLQGDMNEEYRFFLTRNKNSIGVHEGRGGRFWTTSAADLLLLLGHVTCAGRGSTRPAILF